MPLSDLSQLLWSAQGVTAAHSARKLRTAPSAGACYPIETYVAAGAVHELKAGLWRYVPENHALELVGVDDIRGRLADKAHRQSFVAKTPVVVCLTLTLERTAGRYGERAFRYACMDAGHLAENLALAATGLGYGTCMVGAFDDRGIAEVLGLDPNDDHEVPLYLVPVGVPDLTG